MWLGIDDETFADRGAGAVSLGLTDDNFSDSRRRIYLAVARQLDINYSNPGSTAGDHSGVTPGLQTAIPGLELIAEESISNAPRILTAVVVPGRIPGLHAPDPGMTRPFKQLADDIDANPGRWETLSAHTEKASRKGARRHGASTQVIYRNKDTGETIVRHTVLDDMGRVVDDH